jgi:alpha-tubulin suppressor-like RCC1 family protein
MPVIIRNKSYDITFGHSPIEKMGGDNIVTYSMYGDEIPLVLEDGEQIIKIKSEDAVTWYLTDKGNLYGTGINTKGQQGTGDTTKVTTFTKRASNVRDFDCSDRATWYIDNNNDLYGCGLNSYGQQGDGTQNDVLIFTKRAENVKKVRSTKGTYNTFYLTNDGLLYGCGYGAYGALGNGTSFLTKFSKRASNVKDFECSPHYYATWYLTNDGDLYGTGTNYEGQQGSGNTTQVNYFTKRASNVKEFKLGVETTWYIDNDNNLYGCGENGYFQQGAGLTSKDVTKFTKRADNVKKVIIVDNGIDSVATWYITNNGDLYGCGWNGYGNHGSNSRVNVYYFTKRASNVKDAYPTPSNTYYITNDDELYGCGYNSHGELGTMDGTVDSTYGKSVLTFIKLADNVKYMPFVSAKTYYITNNDELYHSIPDGSEFAKISDNILFAYAPSNIFYATHDGKLYGRGSNGSGQLGLGDVESTNGEFIEIKPLKE